jgi:hypothetical protein
VSEEGRGNGGNRLELGGRFEVGDYCRFKNYLLADGKKSKKVIWRETWHKMKDFYFSEWPLLPFAKIG